MAMGYKKVRLAIGTAIEELSSINIEDHCNENSKAIFHLNAALNALEERNRREIN